ncbi:MAG: hypothetical protein NZ108_09680, partial [Bacteroidia bacterium]|nr:hypothetical protein [Bacteroidia bacterium]
MKKIEFSDSKAVAKVDKKSEKTSATEAKTAKSTKTITDKKESKSTESEKVSSEPVAATITGKPQKSASTNTSSVTVGTDETSDSDEEESDESSSLPADVQPFSNETQTSTPTNSSETATSESPAQILNAENPVEGTNTLLYLLFGFMFMMVAIVWLSNRSSQVRFQNATEEKVTDIQGKVNQIEAAVIQQQKAIAKQTDITPQIEQMKLEIQQQVRMELDQTKESFAGVLEDVDNRIRVNEENIRTFLEKAKLEKTSVPSIAELQAKFVSKEEIEKLIESKLSPHLNKILEKPSISQSGAIISSATTVPPLHKPVVPPISAEKVVANTPVAQVNSSAASISPTNQATPVSSLKRTNPPAPSNNNQPDDASQLADLMLRLSRQTAITSLKTYLEKGYNQVSESKSVTAIDAFSFAKIIQLTYVSAINEGQHTAYEQLTEIARRAGFEIEDRVTGK